MQKLMGTHSAVGQQFSFMKRTGNIVGVMKNFNHCSLVNSIEPFVFMMGNRSNRRPNYLVARLQKGNITSAIKSVRSTWEKINPQFPFEYTFFNDDFAEMYQSDRQMSLLFRYAAVFAVAIACIGLFGLVSFISEKRKKEIGIRKVLGASVTGVCIHFTYGFMKWIHIANFIAWPVSYIAMNNWLQNFAYRIDLEIGVFAASGLITLFIALLTVSYQSIKTARANPVDSLRYE
jgi:putative ABC transport system permease protein